MPLLGFQDFGKEGLPQSLMTLWEEEAQTERC